jgi:hypothetical protein
MSWRSVVGLSAALILVVVGCSSSGKKAVDDTSGQNDAVQGDIAQFSDQKAEEQRSGDQRSADVSPPPDATQCDSANSECEDAGDCGTNEHCVLLEDGCTSLCVPEEGCQADDECGPCVSCVEGDCIPLPCPVECMVDDDCGVEEICITNNGCCGFCQAADLCAEVDCIEECDLDVDCGPGESCIWWGEGCCSQCQAECEICYINAGTFCPQEDPPDGCEIGQISIVEVGVCWFEVTYVGESATDVVLANGCVGYSMNLDNSGCGLTFDEFGGYFEVACNFCGTVEYAKENCDCVPDCVGKACGDDGCGGSCGECDLGCFCNEAWQCAGCAEELIELEPTCVHVPSVVQAGEPFAVAVYGLPGCSIFDHYEVDSNGTEYQITLYGTASADPDCPPLAFCEAPAWTYLGLVWLDAPNPGAYTVKVGNSFTGVAGATGGIIDEPACQDDCASPALENYDWTLDVLTNTPLLGQCLESDNGIFYGLPLAMTGECQDYVLGEIIDLTQVPAKHCNDGHIIVGTQAPYWMEGTVCGTDPIIDGHPTVILGTIQDSFGSPLPEQLFMATGIPLWN